MERHKNPTKQCLSMGRVTAGLLLSFLAVSATSPATASFVDAWNKVPKQAPLQTYLPPIPPGSVETERPLPKEHEFKLKHIFHHGTHLHPRLHKKVDVDVEKGVWALGDDGIKEKLRPLRVKSDSVNIQRLSDRGIPTIDSLLNVARLDGRAPILPQSSWTTDKTLGPNVTDRDTIINLAVMAADAYDSGPGIGDWEDVKGPYNLSESFGWEGDGLRGHVFADEGNSTIILALKGTSPAVFDGDGTTTNDKINDNLFFSCCCGSGGQYLWLSVCDCYTSTYTCNQTCVVQSLRAENRYYRASIELYGNVTDLYPHSNIWFVGHSLGGSISALLGQTFGFPVVTFQAVGDDLPARRLGLPKPPEAHPNGTMQRKDEAIYHFGHTADPIFMGTCNAATSGCTLGGYALQTQCHSGRVCIYDVVEDKKWRVSIRTHSIRSVITDVLRAYDTVPACEVDSECRDCSNWKYFESNGTESTTSKTSTATSTTTSQTRTTTCKTPGWWGCLDQSTTTTTTTSSSTSTSSTTTVTCTHYGWFGGCLDPTSTTSASSAAPSKMTTTSVLPPTTSTSLMSTSCRTPGFFFGCKDKDTTGATHAITPAPVY